MITAALAFNMTACGIPGADESAENAENETIYQIGVLQYANHTALFQANYGFFAALNEAGIRYEWDQQRAEGDLERCGKMAEELVSHGNDLIFAIGTPAAQAAAKATKELPIVVTAVTDPAEVGLAETNKVPGGNVTGTSDLTPVKQQMNLLMEILPETKTVGILYCTEEADSVLQVDMAKQALKELGVAYKEYTVSSEKDVYQAEKAASEEVDALYTPADNWIADHMDYVAEGAKMRGIPLICAEEGQVAEGGLVTIGIDYYELGYRAGLQAIEILTNGALPSEMPIGYMEAETRTLKVNEETLAALEKQGMDFSVLIEKMAEK